MNQQFFKAQHQQFFKLHSQTYPSSRQTLPKNTTHSQQSLVHSNIKCSHTTGTIQMVSSLETDLPVSLPQHHSCPHALTFAHWSRRSQRGEGGSIIQHSRNCPDIYAFTQSLPLNAPVLQLLPVGNLLGDVINNSARENIICHIPYSYYQVQDNPQQNQAVLELNFSLIQACCASGKNMEELIYRIFSTSVWITSG